VTVLSPALLLQAVVSGILFGGVYAAIGLGLGLVWGVMRILNIGHAALAILGAYLSLTLILRAGMDPLLSLVFTIPALFLIGMGLQQFVVRPMGARKEAELHIFLILYGIMVAVENLSVFIWSADVRLISAPYTSRTLSPFGLIVPVGRLISFVIGAAAVAVVYVFLRRAKVGRAVRAIASDREAAALMGISVHRVSMAAFGLSTATAAVAGLALGLVSSFFPGIQIVWISKAFLVVVLGGVDNVLGLFLAALLLGVAENVIGIVAPAFVVDFVAYVLLIVTLMVRPQGLLRKAAA
jgi:branched-chain amino acid transport system permease protein